MVEEKRRKEGESWEDSSKCSGVCFSRNRRREIFLWHRTRTDEEVALGGRWSAATVWLSLPHPSAEKGARLPLRPMDLNSNPGLCLYITVINANTFACGSDCFIMMAGILLG